MRIRIKYCGGCNASYDRVGFVSELADIIRRSVAANAEFIHNDETVDKGIIICGCSACCADRSEINNGTSHWHIVGPDLLDYVYIPQARIIDKLLEKIVAERRKVDELDRVLPE